jgi:hypothetical protein
MKTMLNGESFGQERMGNDGAVCSTLSVFPVFCL